MIALRGLMRWAAVSSKAVANALFTTGNPPLRDLYELRRRGDTHRP